MTLVIPETPGMLRSLGSPGTPGIPGMLVSLGSSGTPGILCRDQRGSRDSDPTDYMDPRDVKVPGTAEEPQGC